MLNRHSQFWWIRGERPQRKGVTNGLLSLSADIAHMDDLIDDLDQPLKPSTN